MLTHVKKLTHTKKFDLSKNIFDPRNPRKNYEPRKRYLNPRNPGNPRKIWLMKPTHATDRDNSRTHVDDVTTQPTQFSRLDCNMLRYFEIFTSCQGLMQNISKHHLNVKRFQQSSMQERRLPILKFSQEKP